MIELRDNYWAVEVPDDATGFTIEEYKVRNVINERDMNRIEWYEDRPTRPFVIIPPGNWQIVCISKEVTEGQAKGIVHETFEWKGGPLFEDYTKHYLWLSTASESLDSLLTSKGCDLNKTYLILKKL